MTTDSKLATMLRDGLAAIAAERTEARRAVTAANTFKEPYTVTRKCPVTGEWFSVTVETADWQAWRNLESPLKPAALYFPYLKETEVEFLLSGITNNGIQHLFRDSEIVDVECED